MNSNYFEIWDQGFDGQLTVLDLEQVVVHLENYLCAQLPGPYVCSAYLNRMLKDQGLPDNARACYYVKYLFDKLLRLKPFAADIRDKYLLFFQDPATAARREELKGLDRAPDTLAKIVGLDKEADHRDITEFCLELLKHHPDYIQAADYLLDVDAHLSRNPSWVNALQCPPPLKPLWQARLFSHFASQANFKAASRIWPTLDPAVVDEPALNLAAEMFAAQGDTAQASELYARSLELDPLQIPVRLRLEQLRSPFTKVPGVLDAHRVCICLYSWNKAQLLSETLESLFASDIGQATIRVLINGSTDDSLERMAAIKAARPEADFEYFALPVNIGAPAARNWLISLPEAREADYVAFMDDDVLVEPDWLEWMLSTAESDPDIGVVGCKIVGGREPYRWQFLYRHINIAVNGLLRFCFEAPMGQCDTGLYDFVVETRNVMGCLHLFRGRALRDAPTFDIRFSPSQVDDLDHDIELCLKGWKVYYCGLTACVHRQQSGVGQHGTVNLAGLGSTLGNDIKLHYKHAHHMDELAKLDNLSLPVYRDMGVFPVRPTMKPGV